MTSLQKIFKLMDQGMTMDEAISIVHPENDCHCSNENMYYDEDWDIENSYDDIDRFEDWIY